MYETDVPAQCAQTRQDPRFPKANVDQSRSGGHPLAPGKGTSPAIGLSSSQLSRYQAPDRIRSRRTFSALRRTPARGRSGPVTVAFVEAAAPGTGLVAGYAVGCRVGTAVARNRLRRRLRASMAEQTPRLPEGAYLVSVGLRGDHADAGRARESSQPSDGAGDLQWRRQVPGGEAMRTTGPGTAAWLERRSVRSVPPEIADCPRPGRAARAMVAVIRTYQLARTGRPTGCRFTPSCSSYAIEAVEHLGPWAGGGLALRRLMRCHPWGGSGFDPVPERRTA